MAKKQEAIKRALGTLEYTLGFEIMNFLQDKDVNEIIVNPDTKIWVDTFSKGRVLTDYTLDSGKSEQIIYQVADLTNTVCSASKPTLGAELPDGSRFQGFLPDVVTAPSFIIRKHTERKLTLMNYVNDGVLTPRQREIILEAIRDRKNIIAAGGTKTGKTTFLNAILAEMSKTDDRIVLLEDTRELKCAARNYLSLKTTENCSMNDLLHDTLRATPDRIVVGEVRGDEALALLDAWNTGHDGGCSTVHSSSAMLTLRRLEQLVSRVSVTPQQETIAGAVDMIVYLRRKGTGRVVEEILSIDGYDMERGQYITHEVK